MQFNFMTICCPISIFWDSLTEGKCSRHCFHLIKRDQSWFTSCCSQRSPLLCQAYKYCYDITQLQTNNILFNIYLLILYFQDFISQPPLLQTLQVLDSKAQGGVGKQKRLLKIQIQNLEQRKTQEICSFVYCIHPQSENMIFNTQRKIVALRMALRSVNIFNLDLFYIEKHNTQRAKLAKMNHTQSMVEKKLNKLHFQRNQSYYHKRVIILNREKQSSYRQKFKDKTDLMGRLYTYYRKQNFFKKEKLLKQLDNQNNRQQSRLERKTTEIEVICFNKFSTFLRFIGRIVHLPQMYNLLQNVLN